jgi:deoxyribonucleoside regulator
MAPDPIPAHRKGRETDVEFLREVAVRVLVKRETQESIASELGVHNSTISRALRRATDLGLVQVTIVSPLSINEGLGDRVRQMFRIKECVAVQTPQSSLANAAPPILMRYVRSGGAVGVSWGLTLSRVVRALPQLSYSDVDVRPVIGGFGRGEPSTQPHEVAAMLAEKCERGTVSYLEAPALVDSARSRRALADSDALRLALARAAEVDVALIGIGAVGPDATLFRTSQLGEDDRTRLVAKGAVGEVCAHFLAADGSRIDDPVEERLIAVDLDELRAIQTTIAFAHGRDKLAAIAAVLRSGVVDVLLTDVDTAERLIQFGAAGRSDAQSEGVAR